MSCGPFWGIVVLMPIYSITGLNDAFMGYALTRITFEGAPTDWTRAPHAEYSKRGAIPSISIEMIFYFCT
jgi:hypothetical protein